MINKIVALLITILWGVVCYDGQTVLRELITHVRPVEYSDMKLFLYLVMGHLVYSHIENSLTLSNR